MAERDTENRRERDMILAPNEFAFISDETKGEVNVFVGPNKTSLAGTDRPVNFDAKTKRFVGCDLARATQVVYTAPEGWYITLKNVAEGDRFPTGSGKLSTPGLRVGKKVNISGPCSFALWPGQMAKVVQGHNLKSNEYLLVRVYDEDAARANWTKAVIKAQDGAAEVAMDTSKRTAKSSRATIDIPSEGDMTMGKLFIIRGTDVSFYIPSTGLEVVPEFVNGEERFVREAVSLERLEYCLLLDQDGTKRYVHGPAVVFPRPTEKFVEAPTKSNPDKVKAKKFRAQELTPTSGIHVRVIADYTEDDDVTHRKTGDELFITGKDQTIYYPREEHAIIKYGEQEIHYGLAIPTGESRYVLNRESGVISLVVGPQIFLPDPRTQVIVNRALPLDLCRLIYPNNQEALNVNAQRLDIEDQDTSGSGAGMFSSTVGQSGYGDSDSSAFSATYTPDTSRRIMIKGASKSLPGDAFDRKNKFTAPRTIVLNTKYDGAVTTELWTGYAMLLVRKSGDRRVVQGPGTFMLEYDESPQVINLSSGNPKTTDTLIRTVFLQTTANKVSDTVMVETRDFVKLNVKLSYRVNFEGEPLKWFNIDNYVKFLTDHMRSKVRNAVKKMGIEDFYANSTDVLRDVVLGRATETGKQKTGRPGTLFDENGMRIYDVEVLDVAMLNADVEKMLMVSQRDTIQNTILLASERRRLDFVKETEELKRQTDLAKAETARSAIEIQIENAKRKLDLELTSLTANGKLSSEKLALEKTDAEAKAVIERITLDSKIAERDAAIESEKKAQEVKLSELNANVQAVVEKAKAISPGLIEALGAFGERALVEKVAEAMAPMSIITGGKKSVIEALSEMLRGTSLARQLDSITSPKGK